VIVESLPFIDEHRREVRATPERTWEAVVRFVHARLTRPAPASFVRLWRLSPTSGFAIAEEIAPRRLALRGQHRFSRYELAFEIAPGSGSVVLTARTSAEFLGISGSAYRALVIGSGGHGVIVRQMLRRIAKSAERAG
jgi:hypothetical protein